VLVDNHRNQLALWYIHSNLPWKHVGSRGNGPGQFVGPKAVAVTSAGALVVTDCHRVQVLTTAGVAPCLM
jgi:hypothetical protein